LKIAIVGANGQVGAEVTLRLRGRPGVEVVPICRHSGGSAFLRYHGAACRHGRPADAAQAAALFGDCDVIANFALGTGTPAEASRNDRLMIANSIIASPKSAVIIYFSTLAVYGDPTPGRWIRWKTSYGRAKLRAERYALKLGRQYGKPVYILRLGHVTGALQSISGQIQDEVAARQDIPWADERKSNTTHTVAIADAIIKIAMHAAGTPGVYDLVNVPQWSWREVYAYEARSIGAPFEAPPRTALPVARNSGPGWARTFAVRMLGKLTGSPTVRETGLRLAAYLSPATNSWLQARHFRTRARGEIAALDRRTQATGAVNWREFPETGLAGLTPTRDLIDQETYRMVEPSPDMRWPADLAPAAVSKSG
jgi:nucleoside-diphosphate-sugar epimerase